MKKIIFFAWLLAISFACRVAPEYKPNVISQSSILGNRLATLDEQHEPEKLCEDYQFFLKIRQYLHNDAMQMPASQECPKDFSDFALKIKDAIASLKDLHATALFGNGLDSTNYPVITACEGDSEVCEDILGAPVYPIRTNVETRFYAGVFGRKAQLLPLEVKTVNAEPILNFRKAMDAGFLYSHTKANWAQNLMDFVLKRPVLSRQDRSDLRLETRSLASQKVLTIQTSFESVQRVFPNAAAVASLQTILVGREYGCVNTMAESTFEMGACQRADGRFISWMSSWPQADTFEAYQKILADWLVSVKAETIHLDMRSNGGGSPITPIGFLCRFGDDDSVNAILKSKLSIRSFPRQWVMKGVATSTETLDILDNKDLLRIDMDFEVRSGSNEEVRYYDMSVFERSKLDEKACKDLRVKELAKTKWKVLTDGGEFSAAEDFLLLAKESPKKFQIYGRPSVGGAGNPMWISLPHTKAGVRLSVARNTFDGMPVIEKKGVTPDYFIWEQETAEEIEARMLRFIDQGMLAKNDFMPKAFLDKFLK